jgi:hypothetical protein
VLIVRVRAQFFKDKVHPGEAFRGLWSDIQLYHLRESFYNPKTRTTGRTSLRP